MCAEMGKNVGAFPRKYAKADMVHVAPLSAGTRSALLPEFSVHGNEVDETSAHPQLIKSDSRLMLFETGAQHVRVEGDHLFQIGDPEHDRSEEHTSELQSLMRTSYAVFCLKKKKT